MSFISVEKCFTNVKNNCLNYVAIYWGYYKILRIHRILKLEGNLKIMDQGVYHHDSEDKNTKVQRV